MLTRRRKIGNYFAAHLPMAHGPFHDPDFDFDTFRSAVTKWAAAGGQRVIIEWQTGPGPVVSWYPASERQLSVIWRVQVSPESYNEQYADYLEYRLMPRLFEIARAGGLEPRAFCVDQQPIMVMRMRRRELERAEHSSSGHAAHATNSFG